MYWTFLRAPLLLTLSRSFQHSYLYFVLDLNVEFSFSTRGSHCSVKSRVTRGWGEMITVTQDKPTHTHTVTQDKLTHSYSHTHTVTQDKLTHSYSYTHTQSTFSC